MTGSTARLSSVVFDCPDPHQLVEQAEPGSAG